MTNHTMSSHRGRRVTIALAAALAGTAAAVTATAVLPGTASAETRSAHAAATARLASLAQQEVAAGVPGVIVRVSDGSGPAIEIAKQAPWTKADHTLTANDQFHLGSNSKTMTATVILQLVAEHRLALTDPVSKWLPGVIPNGQAITLRMLLNHTSGLFDYIQDPAVLKAFSGQDARPWTPDQLIAAAVSHQPLFAPGKEYSYSNTNYIALGLVAEKVTGKGLGDLIQERIARPLGLKNTYLVNGFPQPGNPRLANGYEPDAAHLAPVLPPYAAGTSFAGPARGAWVNTTWINPSTEWAAGGMVSTAADWARFQGALLSGKLLPPAQLKEMQTTVSEGSSTPNQYGLGLEKTVTPCGTVWGHDGQTPGYSSWDYTDSTGHRTASVFTTTIFGLATPKAGAATQALINATVCTMLGK
ncbi:MAG: serine hydrolase domain-containing protein [Trebonia sp.]